MEGEPEPEATLFPQTVGEKLRAAREAQGVSLVDIATSTRIPQRHLEAIEKSNYASLPSITYALGFAKAYARAVEVDEVAIARELRGELATTYEPRAAPAPVYDLDGPRRNAPGGLVWVSLIIVVLLVAAIGVYYGTDLIRGTAPEAEGLVIPPEETPTPEPGNEVVAGAGQVALIALDTVWLRVTDGTGKTLFEKEMKAGERYDVPADADHPRARVARPDKIQVTLNGSNVAPLGEGAVTVDVEISADALLARGQPGTTPTSAPLTGEPSRTRQRPIPRPSPTAATPPPAAPLVTNASGTP
jgi:transcriptional regulator with XRE-family HTH domain